MFSIFKGKPNYEQLFSSASDIHQHIYGNKTRTADILGNEEFIEAWLASKHISLVTSVIKQEALKGDIPSLKQMIWLNDIYYNNADNLTENKSQQQKIKIDSLKDRILFCERAIALGLTDQSYYAMTSCAKLYALLAPRQTDLADETTKNALNGIVNHARRFIASGYDDPELIDDAKRLLAQFAPIAALTDAFNAPRKQITDGYGEDNSPRPTPRAHKLKQDVPLPTQLNKGEEETPRQTESNMNSGHNTFFQTEINANSGQDISRQTETDMNSEQKAHSQAEINVNSEHQVHPQAEINANCEHKVHPQAQQNINGEQDIQSLIEKQGMNKAVEIIRDAALKGNLFCQKFLSGAGLHIPEKDRTDSVNQDIERFTRLAAEGGDMLSQFNLALLFMKKN
ncbi:hypothetical protein ABK905_14835 [Acerihabitans sp. KWT182]|uniref:Uncharacterized protein n=1 Tax=Acerihabitans sp. KWT182 TaxID=3157919 RepID=A0AAU7Q544_9GAMM